MIVFLEQFCDPKRRAISSPFSLNEHTYATNGHIIVRVPRHSAQFPEQNEPPNVEGLPWDFSRVTFEPLPDWLDIPGQCSVCDGRGFQHDCPSCRCECELCKGTGENPKPVQIGEAWFDGRYIGWIQPLSGLEIGKPKSSIAIPFGESVIPLAFRFEGGDRPRPAATVVRHSS
jgi:hypothetical protein